jgi:DNA repair exonuclease SbcCD ATPase subunit
MQAENRASMEKERLSGKLQEAQAAASKLEQQLSSCQQELADASREASKAKMQLEEARAARMTLQARADEAERTVSHLRGLVSAVPGHGVSHLQRHWLGVCKCWFVLQKVLTFSAELPATMPTFATHPTHPV